MHKGLFLSGGATKFIAIIGAFMLQYTDYQFNIVVSVYTPSKEYKRIGKNQWKKNLIRLFLDFVVPTFNIEISKNDEEIESKLSTKRAIKLQQVFIEPFANWLFDVHPKTLQTGYLRGVEAIDKYYD